MLVAGFANNSLISLDSSVVRTKLTNSVPTYLHCYQLILLAHTVLFFSVEYILQNTDLSVTIYNGNMDAVSNTPGKKSKLRNTRYNV